MKLLFVVGTCIRLLATDPWQALTWRVTAVGQHSYRVVAGWQHQAIPEERAKYYGEVNCVDNSTIGGLDTP